MQGNSNLFACVLMNSFLLYLSNGFKRPTPTKCIKADTEQNTFEMSKLTFISFL